MTETAELLHDERLSEDERSALSAGDQTCWERTYRRIHTPLYGYCLRLCGNETAAFDLTQESFVRAMKRCRERGTPEGLKAFLYTTARNLHFDASAKHSSRDVSSDAHEGMEFEEDSALAGTQPEVSALVEEQRDDVISALAELPDRQRQALAMCDMEGCSYAEAGKALNLEENAVGQLVFRARGKLRLALRMRQIDESALPEGCRTNIEAISRMLDGQLKGAALTDLQAHFADCDACRNVREDFALVQKRYRALAPLALMSDDDSWANMMARSDTQEALGPHGRSWKRRHSVASVLTLVGIAILVIATAISFDDTQTSTVSAKKAKEKKAAAEKEIASDSGGENVGHKSSPPASSGSKSENNASEDSESSLPPSSSGDDDNDSGTSSPPPASSTPPPAAASPPPPAATPPPPPAPDPANLVANSISYDGSSAHISISNTGGSTAGSNSVRVKIGKGSWYATVPSLSAGSSTSVAVAIGCKEGTFTISATVDYAGAVTESSEGDNSASDSASWIC